MSGTSAISTTSRRELSSSPPPPLKSKAPKEIHAILTETLASFLPGQAKDLSAPLYRGAWGIASHIEQKCLVEYYWPTTQYSFLKFIYLFYLFFFFVVVKSVMANAVSSWFWCPRQQEIENSESERRLHRYSYCSSAWNMAHCVQVCQSSRKMTEFCSYFSETCN